MSYFAVKGENSSCTILSLSSLDSIFLRAVSQNLVKPTYTKALSMIASFRRGARRTLVARQ